MKTRHKFYNAKEKTLDYYGVIEALKEASKDYQDGAIIECRDTLREIADAIDAFAKDYDIHGGEE